MGDMADYYNESWADRDSWEGDYSEPTPPTCKHCGMKNLQWKDTKEGWRLCDSAGKLHVCSAEARGRRAEKDFKGL